MAFPPAPSYPGNLLLFGKSLLEVAVVSVTSAEATRPKTRLYDRDRGPQWRATTEAVQDIDIDQGALLVPLPVSHVAFVNYTVTTQVTIYRGSTPAAISTLIATIATFEGGDPYVLDLGGTFTDRCFRIRIAAGGVIPAIGEIFLGVPQIVALPPFVRNAGRHTLGNVATDSSPARYRWSAKKGPKLTRLPFGWTGLRGAELAVIEAAHNEIDQGAKNLVVRDELGVARWMKCMTDTLEPVPAGGDLYELPALVFEEAL